MILILVNFDFRYFEETVKIKLGIANKAAFSLGGADKLLYDFCNSGHMNTLVAFPLKFQMGHRFQRRGPIGNSLGGKLGSFGGSLGSLPTGFFLGVPLFWDNPKVKFCIFFQK